MKYVHYYDERLMRIHDFSYFKFIFIVYALMCTWSSLTHDVMLSLSTIIDHHVGVDLSYIYSYGDVWQGIDYLGLIVIAPLLETIIFQVFIQNIARKITSGILLSLFITAILFALIHVPNNVANAVNALGLGFAFATTYEFFRVRKGHWVATIVTIMLHAFWNSTLAYSFFPDKLMS